MSEGGKSQDLEQRPSADPQTPLPGGYRAGVITAITVVLGFSFLFLRSWVFELPGEWTVSSAIAALLLLLAIVLELVALWRSLQLKDDHVIEYQRTLRWFLASTIVLLVSLVIAALSYSHLFKS
jgi:hypothetical protein